MSTPSVIPYVLALITKKSDNRELVLLTYRSNTGFADNSYALVGGKIEIKESPTLALKREIKEEIDLEVETEALGIPQIRFFEGQTGPCIIFTYTISIWRGNPINREPEKHDHIKWFPLDNLPPSIIPRHAAIISDILGGVFFSEEGFEK